MDTPSTGTAGLVSSASYSYAPRRSALVRANFQRESLTGGPWCSEGPLAERAAQVLGA